MPYLRGSSCESNCIPYHVYNGYYSEKFFIGVSCALVVLTLLRVKFIFMILTLVATYNTVVARTLEVTCVQLIIFSFLISLALWSQILYLDNKRPLF